MTFFQGVSVSGAECGTCGKGLAGCAGHFGYIDLELPVYHVGYFNATLTVLQSICKSCSRVLLNDKQRKKYSSKLKSNQLPYLTKKSLKRLILADCKKVSTCQFCNEKNGVVKKCGLLKISHEKYRSAKKDSPLINEEMAAFDSAVTHNRELDSLRSSGLVKVFSPLDVQRLLEGIPDEDVQFLLMNPEHGHPKDMILNRIAVPPPCIRPSVVSDLKPGTNEDGLTVRLGDVVAVNDAIAAGRAKGEAARLVMDRWDCLQLLCALYFNGAMTGIPSHIETNLIRMRGLAERLKGKQGRFRGNLSGKRVDFSSRTVISPDPNLRVDQVGVPELVAKTLTFPARVNAANIELMRKLVANGTDVHPGANILHSKRSNSKYSLKYDTREALARNLQVTFIRLVFNCFIFCY